MHGEVFGLYGFVFADDSEADDAFKSEFLEDGDYCVCDFGSCSEWSTDGGENVGRFAFDRCGVDEAADEFGFVLDADVCCVTDVVLANRVGRWVVGDDYSRAVFDVTFGEAFAGVEECAKADGWSDEVCDIDGGEVPSVGETECVDVAVGDDCVGLDFFDAFPKVVVAVCGFHGA